MLLMEHLFTNTHTCNWKGYIGHGGGLVEEGLLDGGQKGRVARDPREHGLLTAQQLDYSYTAAVFAYNRVQTCIVYITVTGLLYSLKRILSFLARTLNNCSAKYFRSTSTNFSKSVTQPMCSYSLLVNL